MVISKLLSSFLDQERIRFSIRRNNSVALSFGQIVRYYNFLQIILRHYKDISHNFIENVKKLQGKTKGERGKISEEMQAILEKSCVLEDELHLQIESFYLFSKIMLDKVAQAVENYFGSERAISLVSHHKLNKDFINFANKKGLSDPPESLVSLIDEIQTNVVDFRDDIITHMNNPRSLKATVIFNNSETLMSEYKVYPKDGELHCEGLALPQLMVMLEQYITELITYIMNNNEKARVS